MANLSLRHLPLQSKHGIADFGGRRNGHRPRSMVREPWGHWLCAPPKPFPNVGGWTSQPILKNICAVVKIGSWNPKVLGVKMKNLWVATTLQTEHLKPKTNHPTLRSNHLWNESMTFFGGSKKTSSQNKQNQQTLQESYSYEWSILFFFECSFGKWIAHIEEKTYSSWFKTPANNAF